MKKPLLNLFMCVCVYLCTLLRAQAQQYYYIDKTTGIREKLVWIPTPLGTDARLLIDSKIYKEDDFLDLITVIDEPHESKFKKKGYKIVLPDKQKAVLSEIIGNKIQLTFTNGKTKTYENAEHWVDFSKRPVCDYISVKTIYPNPKDYNGIKTLFLRAFGNKIEVKLTILESKNANGPYTERFVCTIPNKEGKYIIQEMEIKDVRYYRLTSPDGTTQDFKMDW